MIYGIGIDIVEINRIKKIIEYSGDKLAKRIFRKSELEIYYKKKILFISYPKLLLKKRQQQKLLEQV